MRFRAIGNLDHEISDAWTPRALNFLPSGKFAVGSGVRDWYGSPQFEMAVHFDLIERNF
jgi:hypothetical protein